MDDSDGMPAGNGGPPLIPAAQYVRISTGRQQHSTDNQVGVIREYAGKHGMEIVRTYVDDEKNGANTGERDALQKMLADVTSGNADYKVILVHDVSRFGHFQDADPGAHYEYLCKKAGIRIEYCDEMYKKDGSIGSVIIRSVKRAMAQEYARDMAKQLLDGDGLFLESNQFLTLRDHLVKVTAMVRLVTGCACESRDRTGFDQDVHAAMQLAMEELEKVDRIISDNTPTGCREPNSQNAEANL